MAKALPMRSPEGSAGSALERAAARLRAAGIEQPRREAALLLGHLLGMTEAALLARDRDPLAPAVAASLARLAERRAAGEPAAHLLGRREFWGRGFAVDARALVPRPETEHLVELALALPLPATARVLDLGTGTGCLAVTLQAERPFWRVVASDLSPAATALARRNAGNLLAAGAARPSIVVADLTSALRLDRFDLVVANPPYLDPREASGLMREVRDHEPPLALFAPGHALSIVERLLEEARALAAGAWLALEVGAGQAEAVEALATRIGGWRLEREQRDLAGHRRDLAFRRAA
jgi:release factor glutamine methyltransferase